MLMKSSCQRQGTPSRIRRSPSASRRVTMRMSANARSAVASVSTPGVFATTMGTDALDLLFERLAAQDVLARGLAGP